MNEEMKLIIQFLNFEGLKYTIENNLELIMKKYKGQIISNGTFVKITGFDDIFISIYEIIDFIKKNGLSKLG